MRKIVFFFAALAATVSAFAQSEVGSFSLTPKVFFNATSLISDDLTRDYNFSLFDSDLESKPSYKAGFAAGVEAGYQVTGRLALTAGLIYSQQGFQRGVSIEISDDILSLEDNSKMMLGYLNVPILANVYLFKGFAIKAGIQPGFLVSAKNKNDITGKGAAAGYSNNDDVDVKDNCNTVDFSIPVGVSYEFKKGIVLDGRYNIGLTNVIKGDDSKARNSVVQIGIGYKFNL